MWRMAQMLVPRVAGYPNRCATDFHNQNEEAPVFTPGSGSFAGLAAGFSPPSPVTRKAVLVLMGS